MVTKTYKSRTKKAPRKRKPKLLIFIVAYNAEKTIENVLSRIPQSLNDDYIVEVLIIDDASNQLEEFMTKNKFS